jgi:hypothetical protein
MVVTEQSGNAQPIRDEDLQRQQLMMQLMTTEHATLQTARSGAIAELTLPTAKAGGFSRPTGNS